MDIKTLGYTLPLTTKRFKQLTEKNTLWKSMFQHYHGTLINNSVQWKQMFKEHYRWNSKGGCLLINSKILFIDIPQKVKNRREYKRKGICVKSSTSLQLQSLTIEAWLYCNLHYSSAALPVVSHVSDEWKNGFGVQVMDGRIIFFVQQVTNHIGAKFPVRQWFHIAATFCKNTQQACIYINGELKVTKPLDANIQYQDVEELTIGYSHLVFGMQSYRYYWNGMIGNIRIWNYVRTQDEIQRFMLRGLLGIEKGLVLLYTFKPGMKSGDVVIDQSLLKNDGKLMGVSTVDIWREQIEKRQSLDMHNCLLM